MKGLTDIPGILVGHATDLVSATGCTAIICEAGAIGGVVLRGSATGTQETPALDPSHIAPLVHGIMLSGGSAFGLEAASGLRAHLRAQGIGFPTKYGVVPIVTGAILFDLGIGKPDIFPDRAMGLAAAKVASNAAVVEGNVGAGTGATVGKVRGIAFAMKGGVGSTTIALNSRHNGVLVSALAIVNAFGDVFDSSGRAIAGTRVAADSLRLANSEVALAQGVDPAFGVTNTTLCVVATNARLTKIEAQKLAEFGSLGMARAIRPVFTSYDGDLVFALSHGDQKADLDVLGVAAAQAVAEAIVRAVKAARTLAGVPAYSGG